MNRAKAVVMLSTYFPLAMIVVATMMPAPGCAASGANDSDRASAASAASKLDEKATMPLEQIKPVVVAPDPPESVRPLSERAVRRLAKARDLVSEQRFTEASIELERAMRYDPNHPEIHAALAVLHWQARNIERAKDHARRAIEKNPAKAAPHYVLGRCHLEREDRVDAITSLRTARLCSDFEADREIAALTRFFLGTALADEGYVAAALARLEAFEKQVQVIPAESAGPELRLLLQTGRVPLALTKSELFEALSRYADAAEALRPVVDDGLADVATAIRHARMLLRSGNTEGALAAVRAIESDDDAVVALLYEVHDRRGTVSETLDDLRSRMAARPDSAELSLALASTYLKLGRTEDAKAALRRHLKQFTGDGTARQKLVDLHLQEGQWFRAISVCDAALLESVDEMPGCVERIVAHAGASDQRPDVGDPADPALDQIGHSEAYLRALVADAGGNGGAALAWLQRSHERAPKFVPTRAALARKYLDGLRYDDVLRVAARMDEAAPQDASLERLLGLAYERLDDLPRAEVHLRAATQLDRGDIESMYELAKVYRRQGKTNLSQRQLRVLLNARPTHEEARELLAVLYMRERKSNEALKQIDALKQYSNKPTTIARCDTLLNAELRADPELLRKYLMDAMDVGEPDAPTWIAIAETYTDFEPHQQRKAYAKALELDPDNEEAAWQLTGAMQRDLDFEAATDQLRQMLKRRPNRNSWHKELIDVLVVLQRYDDAIAHADSRLALENLDRDQQLDYRERIVRALGAADRTEDQITRLKGWAESGPDHDQWKRWLAVEYVRQEKAELAVPIRQAMYEENPDEWPALGGLVAALSAADRHDRAMQFALDRLSVDPEADNAIWMLASLLADAERLDEALELVHTRMRDTTQRQLFQDFVLASLQRAERFDETIDYIQSLHDEALVLLRAMGDGRRLGRDDRGGLRRRLLHPDDLRPEAVHARVLDLRQRLALALTAAKRYTEARNRLDEWVEAAANPAVRADLQRILAFCLRAEGNEDRANALMEQVLADSPSDVMLNNDVAYAWIDQGIRLEEAEPMIRYALGARPRQGAYLDTYGWLLYKKGDFEGAIKWLTRSRNSTAGDDPVVHDHLGDAYWRVGRTAEAVEMWTKAGALTGERDDDIPISADERRVMETFQGKIDAANAGEEPGIAPLAKPSKPADGARDES